MAKCRGRLGLRFFAEVHPADLDLNALAGAKEQGATGCEKMNHNFSRKHRHSSNSPQHLRIQFDAAMSNAHATSHLATRRESEEEHFIEIPWT